MTLWTRLGLMCVVTWLAACGIQVFEPGKAPAAENQSGWEDPPPPKPEPELGDDEDDDAEDGSEDDTKAEAEDVAEPSGPATLTVQATVKGAPVAAAVRLLDGDGTVVASGKSGDTLSADPGRYTLEVAVEDAKVLADTPTQRSAIVMRPGGSISQPVPFEWAAIQLRVRINGTVNSSAKVDILREGRVVATLQSDAPHVMFSPGRYDAKVRTGGAVIEVPQLLFPEGATRTVPVDVQM